MAKGPAAETPSQPADGLAPESRALRKLERRLSDARAREARRTRRLAKAHRRTEKLQAAIAALGAQSHSAPEQAAHDPSGTDGHRGFCMHERATVLIDKPSAFVMHNGRSAVAGTCHNCGARVVTIAAVPRGNTEPPRPIG